MKYLTQINETNPEGWRPIVAANRVAAAIIALRHAPNPIELLPRKVYVSIGEMRHDNGAPMAIQSYKVKRTVKP